MGFLWGCLVGVLWGSYGIALRATSALVCFMLYSYALPFAVAYGISIGFLWGSNRILVGLQRYYYAGV